MKGTGWAHATIVVLMNCPTAEKEFHTAACVCWPRCSPPPHTHLEGKSGKKRKKKHRAVIILLLVIVAYIRVIKRKKKLVISPPPNPPPPPFDEMDSVVLFSLFLSFFFVSLSL
jgi:hypothetical protein